MPRSGFAGMISGRMAIKGTRKNESGMRTSLRRRRLWLGTVLAVVGVSLAAGTAAAQSGEVARTWDDRPDLNGVWQTMSTANWNLEDHPAGPGHPDLGAIGAIPPGLGVVVGGEIPYTAEARQQRDENFANRMSADPEAKCFMPGVPRANYMPHPFQILQGDRKILMVYGFAEANRTIHMDQDSPEPSPIDSWMGRSHGRWEGDTLVVDAEGFNGEAWFDRAGNFASYALRVEERYTPLGPNVIRYEATLEDPNVFTRPWQISLLLYRRLEENARMLEFKCVEFSEDLLYGHLRREPTR